jgi:uncharacterized membrane protein YhaH (DUF805 family)
MVKRLLDFRGRATRKEFWLFFAASVLLTAIFDATATAISHALMPQRDQASMQDTIFGGLIVLWLVPWFAVCVRRLHDRGKSGWTLLLLYGVPLLLIATGIALSSTGLASSSTIETIRFLSLASSIYIMLELGAGESRAAGDRFGQPHSNSA